MGVEGTLYEYADLSRLSGIDAATIRVWKARGKLPAPDFVVGQSPAWKPETVEAWLATLAAPAEGGAA